MSDAKMTHEGHHALQSITDGTSLLFSLLFLFVSPTVGSSFTPSLPTRKATSSSLKTSALLFRKNTSKQPSNFHYYPSAMSAIRRQLSSTSFREPVIALFSGSARKGSFNTQLAESAAQLLSSSKYGATTKMLDLSSYDLPIYNQDLEEAEGMPPGAIQLKQGLEAADGWFYCSPEYNGSMTPLFVNAMTWASRGDKDGPMYKTFQAKVAVVSSASPGAMGGMRALNPNRQLLANLGVNVLPFSVAVGGAFKAFDESGQLKDENQFARLEKACGDLYLMTRDIANREAACTLIEEHLATAGAYGSVDVAE